MSDGASFAAALGGEGFATSSYDEETGVYTVTLSGDVALEDVVLLAADTKKYKLTGDGTISRAEGYKGALLKIEQGVSLEIAGGIVLDGGAVWTKDGEPVDSAVGATNSSIVATASLIDNIRGALVISENAVLRNNDSYAAVYAEQATTVMSGGSIYANRATSSYGGGIHAIYGSVEMSGGEIWGNVAGPSANASAIYGYSSASVNISNGSVHDNAGPVAVAANTLTVSGGTFSNNLGAALGRSNPASISGGVFSNNAGGAFANTLTSSSRLQLSGSPDFVTDDDAVITALVELVGDLDLGDDVTVRLVVNEYRMGNQVLFGDSGLLEAYHSRFKMAGDDDDLIVNAAGRIDTDPSSFVHNGEEFVAVLGGEDVATWSRNSETGVYTITLTDNVELPRMTYIESGSYVLKGSGTIKRSGNYPGALLKTITGTSLEITGNIVIDGGAVWTKDGQPSESAVGATNTGAVSNMALVDNYGGALKISGDAVLRNNSSNCAVYCDNGTLEITGGQIYGISSRDGGGAVRTVSNSTVTISGGELWGNAVPSNGRGSAVDGESSTVVISGGTFRDSSGPAVVAAYDLAVTDGTFKDNQGAALGTRSSRSVTLSGGTFDGNAGGAFACTYGTSTLKLSGSPDFKTETDATVRSTVQLTGELGDNVMVRIHLNSYMPGQMVLTGSEALIAAYHSRFSLVGADGEYVVSATGEIDANPAQSVSDGDALAAALGGEAFAASSYDVEAGVYTVTLSHDVALSHAIEVSSGSYVLAGPGKISRANGYTASLFQIAAGASLEITGGVVLDGGAVWMKDGVAVDSAVGATNDGVKSVMALVNSYGGNFVLSDNAALCNNDGNPALYANGGSLAIAGGSIYGNRRSGYGAAIDFSNTTFEMTDGAIFGNVGEGVGSIVRGGTPGSTVQISGGAVSGNAGQIAIAGANVSVSAGEFSDNSCTVLSVHESGSASLSGGSFSGNAGGVFANSGSSASLQLSGRPVFETAEDAIVHATVELVGNLGDTQYDPRIQLDSYQIGDQVLFGDEALIRANYQRFSLVSENGEFVVSSAGKVDTDPTSFVSSGDALAAALGGAGVATSSYDRATDTYTVTLKDDVALTHAVIVESGSYVLTGSGTISRGDAYTDMLLKVEAAASLKFAGNVVLDGGAVYTKDGERVDSPLEANDNAGIEASAPLVFVEGGNVVVSGNAVLCNNCDCAAIWAERGSISMDGGSIYGNVSGPDGGTAIFANEGSVKISGGTVRDNWGDSAVAARDLVISGGSFLNNSDFAVVCYDDAGSVAISGGTFSGNGGAVGAFGYEEPIPVKLSGAPMFLGDYDVVIGEVEVAGKLTGSDVPIYPIFADEGAAVVRGTDGYVLTEADVAKLSLPEFDVPPGYYLDFDAANNQLVLAIAQPVLLEAEVVGVAEFDGAAIEAGEDFHLKIFASDDEGNKGDDITANYTVGGGSTPVAFRYRSEGSAVYETGLPSDPGTYEVQATAAADKDRGYARGAVKFTIAIIGGFAVTFNDGQGNILSSQWVVSGAAAKAPADPTRAGFTFKGWDVDFSYVTSDLSVTALWEKAPAVKVANPMVAKAKKAVKVKASKLRKKTQKVAASKAIAVSGAVGKVTYKLVKVTAKKKLLKQAKKKIKVAANGKITLKKGLKKGTYKLKVAVTAAGNAQYARITKTVTVKVKV